MLDETQLKAAIQQAEKQANVCTVFCRSGGSVKDGRYLVHHNGTGPSTTDAQSVYSSAVHGWPVEKLADRLEAWLKGIHGGEAVDLNVVAMETRGPAVAGWPWAIARGPGAGRFMVEPSGAWRWTDGSAP